MPLTREEQLRYSRQLRLPQIGEAGQERLRNIRVLLLGLGGLGSPAALYLAAAGVGVLGVAEHDTVATHNLQRQILFREADAGLAKLEAGFAALRALNAQTQLVAHAEGLTPANAAALVAGYDIVLDGTDNFAARYLANDVAVLAGKPLVHGSVFQFSGQVAVFGGSADAPCYRCLFPEMPDPASVPTCEQAGVFGALCGAVGSLMAMEAVKLATGAGEPLRGKLLMLDLLAGAARTVRVPRNPACPLCGDAPRITAIEARNYVFGGCCATAAAGATGAAGATAADGGAPIEISCEEAAARLARRGAVLLLDVRRADERALCRIGGSLHIPLAELASRIGELPVGAEVITHCHHGQRSLLAAQILRGRGFADAASMRGGIDRWAATLAPDMARY